MRIIPHNEIENLGITPEQCFDWVEDMLMHKPDVILPKKTSIVPQDDVFFNVMPTVYPNQNFAGVKVITRRLERKPALDSIITLFDYKTLLPVAILDGSWITTMRTGAIAVHTISVLANQDFEEVGVMGLGNTGRAAIKILCAKYKDKNFKLKILKYKDQHLMMEEMIRGKSGKENINVKIEFVDSYDSVIRNSDVVISAVTFFQGNFCEDSVFKEGCLIVPIHLRGFMNCDLSFDKVFGDDTEHVCKFKYFDKFKSFAEVSQVIRGEAEGRTDRKERIIAYNVGLSMHDINYANRVYEFIRENNVEGQEFTLNPPTDKIWLGR